MTQLQKEFLLKAAEFYERVPPNVTRVPNVRRERAEAHFRAGRIYVALSDNSRASMHLQTSLTELRQLTRDGPHESRDALGIAKCLYAIGNAAGRKGDADQQRDFVEQSLAELSEISSEEESVPEVRRLMVDCHLTLSGHDPKRAALHSRRAVELCAGLIRDFPDDPKCRETQVRALFRLAQLSSHDENAYKLIDQAIEIATELVAEHPRVPHYQRALAGCYDMQCDLLGIRQLDEVPPVRQKGIDIYRRLTQDFPDVHYFRTELADTYDMHAWTWSILERRDEAEQARRRSAEVQRELVDSVPDNPLYRKNLVLRLLWHATALRAIDRREGASRVNAEAISQARALVELDEVNGRELLDDALFKQCIGQLELNEYAAAARTLSDLIQLDPNDAAKYRNRGRCWQAAGRDEPAQRDFKKALTLDPTHPTAHMHLGMLDLSQGLDPSAVEHFTAAIQAFQQRQPSNLDSHRELWGCYRLRGIAHRRLHRHREAVKDFRSALAASGGSNNGGCFLSGAALCQLGEYPLALETLRNSLKIEEFYYRDTCPSICLTWGSEGKLERARESYNGIVGESATYLALTYARLGKTDEARYWYDKATELAASRGFFKRKGSWKLDIETAIAEVEQLLGRPWLVSPADNAATDFDAAVGRVVVGSSQPCFRIRLPATAPDESRPLGSYEIDLWRNDQMMLASQYSVECDSASRLVTLKLNTGGFDEGVYRISISAGDPLGQPSAEDHVPMLFDLVVLADDLGPRELNFDITRNGGESVQPETSLRTIELIPFGATWKCLDDGSDQGSAWREADFDDSAWKAERLQPKGEHGNNVAASEQRLDGRPKPRTTYFRQCFQLEELAGIPVFRFDLSCSDGVAVYLNGQKLVRENLAWDANYQTLAVRRDLREGVGSSFCRPTMFRVGKNCLAVEIHRPSTSATDLDFELRLSVPRLETVHCELSMGDGDQQILSRSAILRAELCMPFTAGTSNLRRLRRESSPTAETFNLLWMREEPLQWGHDRGSTQIVFDVTDSVQAWCDGGDNRGWTLLPGDEKASVDDWIDQTTLKVWFIPPQKLGELTLALDASHQAEWGLTAKRLRARAEASGTIESLEAR